MKKIFSMVVLALATLSMSAQEDSKITYTAGVGMSSLVGDDTDAVKSKIAFKVGATYNFSISENFSVIPGAELVCKGYGMDFVDGDLHTYSLQIPVLAAYKFAVTDEINLVAKAGPYVAYGLFGSDIEFVGGGKVNVYDDEWGGERLDAGIIAGVSAEFGKWSVGLEYSRGFLKAAKDTKAYNQAYGVTVGYKF
jgi:hypothetical protein